MQTQANAMLNEMYKCFSEQYDKLNKEKQFLQMQCDELRKQLWCLQQNNSRLENQVRERDSQIFVLQGTKCVQAEPVFNCNPFVPFQIQLLHVRPELSTTAFAKLKDAIEKCTSKGSTTKTVNMHNCNLSDKAGELLIQYLMHQQVEVEVLILSNNQLGDSTAHALAQFIKANKKLVEFNIANNSVSDFGAISILNAVHQSTHITKVKVSGNNISKELVKKLE